MLNRLKSVEKSFEMQNQISTKNKGKCYLHNKDLCDVSKSRLHEKFLTERLSEVPDSDYLPYYTKCNM